MLTSVSILLLTSAILPVGSSKDKNPTALDIIESMTDSKYYIILRYVWVFFKKVIGSKRYMFNII